MTARHLKAADRVARPWKNGGGVTRDVMVSPPDADLSSFDWRISIAEVASDGPFSEFAGVDRIMGVLTGAGVRLEIAGRPPLIVTPTTDAAHFPGDAPTGGYLLDGPISDLNVMTRRGVVSARMERIETRKAIALAPASPAMLVWRSGIADLAVDALAASPAPFDAFHAPTAARWTIAPKEAVEFWWIEILPVSR